MYEIILCVVPHPQKIRCWAERRVSLYCGAKVKQNRAGGQWLHYRLEVHWCLLFKHNKMYLTSSHHIEVLLYALLPLISFVSTNQNRAIQLCLFGAGVHFSAPLVWTMSSYFLHWMCPLMIKRSNCVQLFSSFHCSWVCGVVERERCQKNEKLSTAYFLFSCFHLL